MIAGGREIGFPGCGRGATGSWLYLNCLCSWRHDESKIVRFELVVREEVGHGRLGFCHQGGVILRVFVGAFIKEQYSCKDRTRIAHDRPGRELLTIQEDLKSEPVRLDSGFRTEF